MSIGSIGSAGDGSYPLAKAAFIKADKADNGIVDRPKLAQGVALVKDGTITEDQLKRGVKASVAHTIGQEIVDVGLATQDEVRSVVATKLKERNDGDSDDAGKPLPSTGSTIDVQA
jgi:hypothetical protein